ncbi:MAG: hypothetical protein WBM07_07535 [Chitinivibrionales bacterium]
MGAFVFGIKPEVNSILFYGKAIFQGAALGAGRDILIAPLGFPYHIFLEVVHIKSIGII